MTDNCKTATAVPAFTRVAQFKLDGLIDSGFTVSGLAIERAMPGAPHPERGFISSQGLVGWWQPDAAPLVALQAEAMKHAAKGSRMVRILYNESMGTISATEIGDWMQYAHQLLSKLCKPTAVATESHEESHQEEPPPQLWGFFHNDCVHESAAALVSLHRTKANAWRAMHRKQWETWNAVIHGQRAPRNWRLGRERGQKIYIDERSHIAPVEVHP